MSRFALRLLVVAAVLAATTLLPDTSSALRKDYSVLCIGRPVGGTLVSLDDYLSLTPLS